MTKKYLEDLKNDQEVMDVDIEQELFNMVNNLINQRIGGIITTNIFYYCSHLLNELASQTKDIDYYINIDKYINQASQCIHNLDILNRGSELIAFKQIFIIVLGEYFGKTKNLILTKQNYQFYLSTNFSAFIREKELISDNYENLKNVFKSFSLYKSRGDDTETVLNLIRTHIDSFYKYLTTFTTDLSAGKKIWKDVEEYLLSEIDYRHTNMFIQLFILYIFNKIKLCDSDCEKSPVIVSSIIEFLCDKFNYSHINLPEDEKTYCVSLFYDIICNHYEVILSNQNFNERYMYYFARIFIEDCMIELTYDGKVDDNKLLERLYLIILQNQEPLKILITFISILSKLFVIQNNSNFDTHNQKELNIKLLKKIYQKMSIFLDRYSNFRVLERCTLDKDELFNIITNFSTNHHEIKPYYICFFIKCFMYLEVNYMLELEFSHRKKIYVTIFEIFLEFILNSNLFIDSNVNDEEFYHLLELLIIMMKSYSKHNLEDGYLIYKMIFMITRKAQLNSHLIIEASQPTMLFILSSLFIQLIAQYF
jgi:hypothetical protein